MSTDLNKYIKEFGDLTIPDELKDVLISEGYREYQGSLFAPVFYEEISESKKSCNSDEIKRNLIKSNEDGLKETIVKRAMQLRSFKRFPKRKQLALLEATDMLIQYYVDSLKKLTGSDDYDKFLVRRLIEWQKEKH